MPINNKTIPSLSSLILFEASSRLGTFTGAAKELHVTPTAVSKQMKQLERFLNTTLFIRRKTGLELTPKGENYLKTVRKTLNTLSEESQRMNDDSASLALNLDIGTCFSHFWLIPHLDDFRDKYPDITLNITINNERLISNDVNEEYDVAFYYGALNAEPTGMIEKASKTKSNTLLFKERMLLVCSPEFLAKRPDIKNLSHIWQQPLLGLKDVPEFWEGWRSWASRSGIAFKSPKNEIQMEDQVAVIHGALNGAGIALAWDWHVKALIENGQLIALTPMVEYHNNAFFLSHRKGANQQNAEYFIEWVRGLVGNHG